jgi:hypothetical protein
MNFKNRFDRWMVKKDPELLEGSDLTEALYTMCEQDLIIDSVNAISRDQALQIWQLIETLRVKRFPEDLKV